MALDDILSRLLGVDLAKWNDLLATREVSKDIKMTVKYEALVEVENGCLHSAFQQYVTLTWHYGRFWRQAPVRST